MENILPHDKEVGSNWLKTSYKFSATTETVRGGVGFPGKAMAESMYPEPVKKAIEHFFSPKLDLSKINTDVTLAR